MRTSERIDQPPRTFDAMASACGDRRLLKYPRHAVNDQSPIVELRNRLADVERRLDLLERIERAGPAAPRPDLPPHPAPTGSGSWKDIRNWRMLEVGQGESDVRALLGEPLRVDRDPGMTTWYYAKGSLIRSVVRFGDRGLTSWSEPE